MNNKKIQAQMQIDVSFLSKGLSLTKDIQSQLDKVKFTGPLTKHFTDDLSKQFKAIETNYNKMISGLSKKGLNSKQYTAIFEEGNLAIRKNIESIRDVGKAIKEAYNSKEQKDLLKGLEAQKQLLQDIKKLQSSMKQSNAAGARATSKLKDEFGLDFGNSEVRNALKAVKERRGAGKTSLTPTQKTVLGTDDETKVKRIITLYDQIITALDKVKVKQAEINGVGGVEGIEKRIALLEKNVITEENLAEVNQLLAKITSQSLVPSLDAYNAELNRSSKEAEKAAKASQTFKEVLAQFGIVFSAASVARGFKNLVRDSFEFYKSLDSALNEIYVVSNLTSKEVDGLKDSFINMAKETGMALDDVTRSAVLFYQQGLNTTEVMEMTKVTAQFAKVAGIDATDAADKLTAAVNGYCLAAEDASLVADKFNKVAAVSAADINELSTAFSKAAAQANQAGVSMDNYLAYIATMEEATREAPENLGTSLKTIFSRMQQIKTGENTEDTTDVNAVETALRSVGIQLRDTEGQLRDLEEIFDELGPKWNTLDRNTQAYLGTIIAGTRQQSRFITLMQNWDRVLELSEESENSAGQQALMHAKAMESIESKLNQLKVAWQEFVSNLADSSLFKNVIDFMRNFLNLINSSGKPMMLLVTAITLFSKKLKDLQAPLVKKWTEIMGKNGGTGGILGAISGGVKNFFSNNGISGKDKRQGLEENLNKQKQLQEEINKKQDLFLKAQGKKKANLANEIELQNKDLAILQQQEQELLKQNTTMDVRLKKMGAIGMGLMVGGMAIGQKDVNAGGALNSLGSMAVGISQIKTNPIGAAVSIISGAAELGKTIRDWSKNLKKQMTDAINEVNEKSEELKNARTQEKGLSTLIGKYDKLSRKVVKTRDEQIELNNIIQQMGDMTEVETVTDEFGNLSISIADVNEKLEELTRKRKEATKALNEQEVTSINKALGGWFNNTKIYDYLDEFFDVNKGEYKSLLNGVQDGLDDETRNISSNLASTFSNNFKTVLMRDLEKNSDIYLSNGLAKTLTENEDAINKKISSNDWNSLYDEVNYLKQNLDGLSYNDVQDRMERFYKSWSAANKLTEQELKTISETVNTTIFGGSSLLEFYSKVEEMESKASGKYYDDKLKIINNQISAQRAKVGQNKIDEYSAMTHTSSTLLGLTNKQNQFDFTDPKRLLGFAVDHSPVGATINTLTTAFNFVHDLFTEDEEEKKLKNQKKILKELEKQRKEYLDTIVKENAFINNREDAQKWIDSQTKVAEAFKNLNTETQAYITQLSSVTDFSNMTADASNEFAKTLNTAMKGLEGITNNGEKYNYLATYYEQHKDEMSDEVKAKWEEIIQQAFDNLEVATPKTLTEIANELEDIGKRLVEINDIVDEFNKEGAISFNTFKNLASILDNMDLKSLGQLDSSYVDQYIDAIHNLNLAYDENSGYMTMNGDSLKSLQKIQELQTKSKIAGMITELKASRATVQTQLAYIDAQIAGTEAAIEAAKAEKTDYVNVNKIKGIANAEFVSNFTKAVDDIANDYQVDVQNQGEWATAILNNIGKVSDAWSKYFKAVAEGGTSGAKALDELKKEAQNTVNDSSKYKWEGTSSVSGIDWEKNAIGKGFAQIQDKETMIDNLENYLGRLRNTRKQYQATLDTTDLEINALEDMMGKDLSKLFGSGGGKEDQKIEKYIGQLKEIYNILNRIQMLEHRLSTLDTYQEFAQGKDYGDLLKQRLSYNDELLGQYKFLVNEQKQFTNGYKDFINSVDGLEGVFDFDQFGQIIINWEKYNSLQDEAIDGEVTLKQKADDVYNTYTSMMGELQGYFDKYITYLKNTLNLLNEMKSNYVDLEKQAADAVKEIYQKELDAKLEAIDKEMKALEELTQARQKANKERDNAKVLSGYQADLQRAMMDTSGASDANYIKAQQNISDKLDAMAEDKYSEMIDDIKKKLEEEKDVLQNNFDELFSNLDWLYEYLDKDVMGNGTELYKLLQGTDAWQQKSFTERWDEQRDWENKFNSYSQNDAFKQDGIKGVLDTIQSKELEYKELDKALQNQNSKGDANIVQTLGGWVNKNSDNGGNSGGGGGSSYSPSGGGSNQGTWIKTDFYEGYINKDAEKGTFSTKDKNGVEYQPNNYNGSYLKSTGAKAGQAGIKKNSGNDDISGQNIWVSQKGEFLIWNGRANKYEPINSLLGKNGNVTYFDTGLACTQNIADWLKAKNYKTKYAHGGFADFTGPAWMDGTSSAPEAVLDALQTKHFIDFTNTLDKMYSNMGQAGVSNASNVTIDNISFNVESMSSPEDGEKAFNAFVDKFKEIGDRTGLKVQTFKNTL